MNKDGFFEGRRDCKQDLSALNIPSNNSALCASEQLLWGEKAMIMVEERKKREEIEREGNKRVWRRERRKDKEEIHQKSLQEREEVCECL